MTSLILGSLRRERSSTLRALRPCCINDLWLRLDCRICWPRKRSETTTATLLASDARSARLMDDMTILALAPRTGIRNQLLDDLPQHLTRQDQPPLVAGSVNWSERVLIMAAEAVRRPAVGCIGWLDVWRGCTITSAEQLVAHLRCAQCR